MGATDYFAPFGSIRQYLAKNGMTRPGQPPVLVLFVTDGATANERKIQQELECLGDPVFWQFMGFYSPAFLEHLDTMGGRVLDNVGLFDVNNSAAPQR